MAITILDAMHSNSGGSEPQQAHGARIEAGLMPLPQSLRAAAPSQPESGTLRDLLDAFGRHQRVLYLVLSICVGVALVACFVIPTRYEAFGIVQLEKPNNSGLSLDTLTASGSDAGAPDAVSVNIDLQTQVSILRSDALALQVIKTLDLEHDADFRTSDTAVSRFLHQLPFGPKHAGGDAQTAFGSSYRRNQLLKRFSRNLNVRAVAGTRLIRIEYSNPNPDVAAKVVNALIQSLMDYTTQLKLQSMRRVSGLLQTELADLRKRSEELQAQVAADRKRTELYSSGALDASGKAALYSPIIERLTEATRSLAEAEQNRILKDAVARIATTGNAELLSQLSGTAISATGGQGTINSLTLIQSLRAQEASLQDQIARDSTKFGADYPRLIQEKASLAQTQQSLHNEIQRIAERAQNDARVAQIAEQGARETYERNRYAALRLNDQTVDYSIAEHEAEQSDRLYQDLFRRLNEASILAGLHTSALTLVDDALPPARPSWPNRPLFLALGLITGLMLGTATVLLADSIDNRIVSTTEVEALGVAPLALLPKAPRAAEGVGGAYLTLRNAPHSAFSEAVRRLRSSILVGRGAAPPKIILITSSCPLEGKSTVALNLAYSMAQTSSRVLLLEADLRRPSIAQRVGIAAAPGLGELLADDGAVIATSGLADHPNLHIMPAGAVPAFPSELIGSKRMRTLLAQWSRDYDFVIIDSPPILAFTDAEILQTMADATILVTRASLTNRMALRRSIYSLSRYAANRESPAIGVVLNAVDLGRTTTYEYYGY